MPKRSSNLKSTVASTDPKSGTTNVDAADPYEVKNPAAVELGRLGGKKGGKARAESMTAEQRSAAAKKAADARWSRNT